MKTTAADVERAFSESSLSIDPTGPPRVVRDSPKSTSCMVFFNIWDSQQGSQAKALIDRPITIMGYRCFIHAAHANPGVPICTRCHRWGHAVSSCWAPQHQCPACSSPHSIDEHRVAAGCCKGNPNVNPPVLPTPRNQPCPHSARCPNCRGHHLATAMACPFWRHRFDRNWIVAKYSKVRAVHAARRITSNPPT